VRPASCAAFSVFAAFCGEPLPLGAALARQPGASRRPPAPRRSRSRPRRASTPCRPSAGRRAPARGPLPSSGPAASCGACSRPDLRDGGRHLLVMCGERAGWGKRSSSAPSASRRPVRLTVSRYQRSWTHKRTSTPHERVGPGCVGVLGHVLRPCRPKAAQRRRSPASAISAAASAAGLRRGDDQTVASIAHEPTGGGADGVTRDYRASLVHGFVHNQPPRFGEAAGADRGYDQNVRRTVEVAERDRLELPDADDRRQLDRMRCPASVSDAPQAASPLSFQASSSTPRPFARSARPTNKALKRPSRVGPVGADQNALSTACGAT
jgi:hypothetical protein